jgi:hypothetical protein
MDLGEDGLEDRFPDWETLLEFRDSMGERGDRVRFMLCEDEYAEFGCTLDEVSKTSSVALHFFETAHLMVRDHAFVRSGSERNFVFFTPKTGRHKNILFRFTAATHSRLLENNISWLTESFVRLLLASNCDFEFIQFGTICSGNMSQHSFPQLPINHLFHRADALKFVRLSFGQEACECFRDLNSTANSLSFFGCTFDSPDALSHLIRSSPNLSHLETARCKNIMGMFGAQAGQDVRQLRSLVVGAEQLVSPCGQELIAADALRMTPELVHFTIVFHDASQDAVHSIEPNWTSFFQSVIHHCPNLKELSFCPLGRDNFLWSPAVEKSMLAVVAKLWNPTLQEVNHNSGGSEMKWACKEIERALHDRHRFLAVRLSPCREALLAAAIKGRADRKSYMYTLLVENADVLQTN